MVRERGFIPPWNRNLSARTHAMGQLGRIAVYSARYLAGAGVALALLLIVMAGAGLSFVSLEQKAIIDAVARGGGFGREIAVVVDLVNANGLSTERDLQGVLNVVAVTRGADNPLERLAQLSLAAELFRNDVAGYAATVRYVATLPPDARQWLIARPSPHWIELSRRFAGIQANGPGLTYARQTLLQEEVFLGRELDFVQRRMAQRRTCRPLLDQLTRCVDAAPASGQSTSPAWPQRP